MQNQQSWLAMMQNGTILATQLRLEQLLPQGRLELLLKLQQVLNQYFVLHLKDGIWYQTEFVMTNMLSKIPQPRD